MLELIPDCGCCAPDERSVTAAGVSFFSLLAQAGDLRVHRLELAHELDHADVADALLEALDAHLVVLALLRELLAQRLDAAAGLVIVEEARARGRGEGREGRRGAERAADRGAATTHPST